MDATQEKSLNIGYINLRAQTGFGPPKQLQIEKFLKFHKIDILHLQEAHIKEDTFEMCDFITSNYEIIANNASNSYGTASLVANSLQITNIKADTQGRVLVFNVGDTTFANVYLPCGNDQGMRNLREEYISLIIPQLLINKKDFGCIGGDWNCITDKIDATKNQAQKVSASLKRAIKTFEWTDSYRNLYKNDVVFSRYYSTDLHGEGATRIDRQYGWGKDLKILSANYISIAFSDHHASVYRLKAPENLCKPLSPRHKPLFKARAEVVADPVFAQRLNTKMLEWQRVKEAGADIMLWWELLVKPGIKSLLIERGKERNHERSGQLNLLMIQMAYLNRKVQLGAFNRLSELLHVKALINEWHAQECEKVKNLIKDRRS